MGHVYALGGVKPWVRAAAQEIGDKFDIGTIYGFRAGPGAQDHGLGLATDFMVYEDKAKGDQVADYVKANWSRLAVTYVIWQQRIDMGDGKGWAPMEDRGSPTQNHMDHVHVSYSDSGGGTSYNGSMDSTSSDASGGGAGGLSVLAPALAPSTWFRFLEFVAGLALIGFVIWSVVNRAKA